MPTADRGGKEGRPASAPTSRACGRSRSSPCSRTTPASRCAAASSASTSSSSSPASSSPACSSRELDRSGSISWIRFVGRRIRRLLPAAVLVLVATSAVVVRSWLPGLRRRDIGDRRHGRLGATSSTGCSPRREIDYLASDVLPRPCSTSGRWRSRSSSTSSGRCCSSCWRCVVRRPSRRVVALALGGAGGVVVRVVGVVLATPRRSPAFFTTTTRIWELGIGALLAVALAGRARPRPRCAGRRPWAGSRSRCCSPSRSGCREGIDWPGAWALLPTVPTAVLIWVGWQGPAHGPVRVLGTAPMVWVGGLSYSIYLWHWPVIILGGWIAAASAAPSRAGAWSSWPWRPCCPRGCRGGSSSRRSTTARGCATARGPCSPPGSPCRASACSRRCRCSRCGHRSRRPRPAAPCRRCRSWAPPPCSRASRFVAGRRPGVGDPRPARVRAGPAAGRRRPLPGRPAATDARWPARSATRRAATTVALVGDSKAMQWLPALEEAAATRGWRIVTYGKSSCAFSDAPAAQAGAAYPRATPGTPPSWTRCAPTRRTSSSPRASPRAPGPAAAPRANRSSRATPPAGRRWRMPGCPSSSSATARCSPDDLDVCAARHPTELTRCSFDTASAVAGSGLAVQRDAVAAASAARRRRAPARPHAVDLPGGAVPGRHRARGGAPGRRPRHRDVRRDAGPAGGRGGRGRPAPVTLGALRFGWNARYR